MDKDFAVFRTETEVFPYYGVCHFTGSISKREKVYKITSRKIPTADIFDRRVTHVSLQSSKCLFLSCLLSQLSLFLSLQFLLYLSDELKA